MLSQDESGRGFVLMKIGGICAQSGAMVGVVSAQLEGKV